MPKTTRTMLELKRAHKYANTVPIKAPVKVVEKKKRKVRDDEGRMVVETYEEEKTVIKIVGRERSESYQSLRAWLRAWAKNQPDVLTKWPHKARQIVASGRA